MEAIQRSNLDYQNFRINNIIMGDISVYENTPIYKTLAERLNYAKHFDLLKKEEDINHCILLIDLCEKLIKLYLAI